MNRSLRRKIVRRLQGPIPIDVVVDVIRTAETKGWRDVEVEHWHAGEWASPDDRDYSCPTCHRIVRIRGIVKVGTLKCCSEPLSNWEPSPPRHAPEGQPVGLRIEGRVANSPFRSTPAT